MAIQLRYLCTHTHTHTHIFLGKFETLTRRPLVQRRYRHRCRRARMPPRVLTESAAEQKAAPPLALQSLVPERQHPRSPGVGRRFDPRCHHLRCQIRTHLLPATVRQSRNGCCQETTQETATGNELGPATVMLFLQADRVLLR